jgi:hypothetical protein
MDLNDWLKLNSNAIVDLVERHTFEELGGLLQGKFAHDHGNRDKAHNVLAEAIICSMWCGWLSQAKANRGKYPPEWVDGFKQLIVDAFEIGRRHSEVRR